MAKPQKGLKAVIYHATTEFRSLFPKSQKLPDDLYEKLFKGTKECLGKFNIPLIHLTISKHPGWGDENVFFEGMPEQIVYNRELFFAKFLRMQSRDSVFWLTEPDHRLVKPFPELADDIDLCLLRRDDEVAITPCWKLARSSAAPFFEEALQYFDDPKQKKWHGDSKAYIQLWKNMGCPSLDDSPIEYRGMKIELRRYEDYSEKTSVYVQHWKSHTKSNLLISKGSRGLWHQNLKKAIQKIKSKLKSVYTFD